MQLKFTQEGNFQACLRGVGGLNPFERLPLPYYTSVPLLIPQPHLLIISFFFHSSGIYCLLAATCYPMPGAGKTDF